MDDYGGWMLPGMVIKEVVGVKIVANEVAQGTVLGEPMQRIRKNNCRRACVTKSS